MCRLLCRWGGVWKMLYYITNRERPQKRWPYTPSLQSPLEHRSPPTRSERQTKISAVSLLYHSYRSPCATLAWRQCDTTPHQLQPRPPIPVQKSNDGISSLRFTPPTPPGSTVWFHGELEGLGGLTCLEWFFGLSNSRRVWPAAPPGGPQWLTAAADPATLC